MEIDLPDKIATSLKEFLAAGKTGQVALNIHEGNVLNADVREHILAAPKKTLDRGAVAS